MGGFPLSPVFLLLSTAFPPVFFLLSPETREKRKLLPPDKWRIFPRFFHFFVTSFPSAVKEKSHFHFSQIFLTGNPPRKNRKKDAGKRKKRVFPRFHRPYYRLRKEKVCFWKRKPKGVTKMKFVCDRQALLDAVNNVQPGCLRQIHSSLTGGRASAHLRIVSVSGRLRSGFRHHHHHRSPGERTR